MDTLDTSYLKPDFQEPVYDVNGLIIQGSFLGSTPKTNLDVIRNTKVSAPAPATSSPTFGFRSALALEREESLLEDKTTKPLKERDNLEYLDRYADGLKFRLQCAMGKWDLRPEDDYFDDAVDRYHSSDQYNAGLVESVEGGNIFHYAHDVPPGLQNHE